MTDLVDPMTAVDPDTVVAQHGPFLLTTTGMIPTGTPTFDEWEAALAWCRSVEQQSPFWIGDLVAFGEATYGEMYTQAIEETSATYGTLANQVYVAKAISPDRRNPGLTFTHHQEVASLLPKEQAMWLKKAEVDQLTAAQLRHAVKVAKAQEAGQTLDWWVLVKCGTEADASEFVSRMELEGRVAKTTVKKA